MKSYISFEIDNQNALDHFAKVVAALQCRGVTFRVENDGDHLRIYIS